MYFIENSPSIHILIYFGEDQFFTCAVWWEKFHHYNIRYKFSRFSMKLQGCLTLRKNIIENFHSTNFHQISFYQSSIEGKSMRHFRWILDENLSCDEFRINGYWTLYITGETPIVVLSTSVITLFLEIVNCQR